MNRIKRFLRDEEGLTTVEYAIAGGMIALAVVLAFGLLGDQVLRIITELVTIMTNVNAAT